MYGPPAPRDPASNSRMLIGKVTKLNGTSVPFKRPPGKGDDNDLPREKRNADPLRDRAARIGDPRNDGASVPPSEVTRPISSLLRLGKARGAGGP